MELTNTSRSTIAAYFEDSTDARQAVEALHEAGFTSAHIGVAHRWNSTTSSTSRSNEGEKTVSTWDKIKQMFNGDEVEPYADERTRGDLATHEITENPDNSYYSGRYDSSELHQSFSELDLPEDRSRYFAHRLGDESNGAVVTVRAGDRRSEAESILTRYGGDMAENAATYDYEETAGRSSRTADLEESQSDIQLLGEVLRVHKDRVNRGEVRIRKEVVTENQTIQVPVTREELVIERRAGNESTPATGTIGESEIRIPLSEERVSADKSTVVREEVSVGKRKVEDVRDLTDEVRHEELVVEDPTNRVSDPTKRVA